MYMATIYFHTKYYCRPLNNCCVAFVILTVTHCGRLDVPSHGSKQGTSNVVDSVVTFSCDRGYRLQGSENRTCTSDGTWDGEEAQCNGQSWIHYVIGKVTKRRGPKMFYHLIINLSVGQYVMSVLTNKVTI